MLCNLCQAESAPFFTGKYGEYSLCPKCQGISLAPKYFLNPEAEQKRYALHKHNLADLGYRKFVAPLVEKVCVDFGSEDQGLDYGCGDQPILQQILKEKNLTVAIYDPFFHNNLEMLKTKYNYIVCCEVIEHFQQPAKEFQKLHSVLKPHGKLYCLTDLYHGQDFGPWTYKNDPTHVFFYQTKTIEYLKNLCRFSNAAINERIIEFTS